TILHAFSEIFNAGEANQRTGALPASCLCASNAHLPASAQLHCADGHSLQLRRLRESTASGGVCTLLPSFASSSSTPRHFILNLVVDSPSRDGLRSIGQPCGVAKPCCRSRGLSNRMIKMTRPVLIVNG